MTRIGLCSRTICGKWCAELMNLAIVNERLTRLISRFAEAALETRQVAKRLNGLLPSRFSELKREHARESLSAGEAERRALTDPRYVSYLEELSSITGSAAEARVQYETHAMLYKARQSLRRGLSKPAPRR